MRQEGELWGRTKENERLCWFDSPIICRYINQCISGRPDVDWLEYIKTRYFPEPAALGLNLGCGHGELERMMIRRKVAKKMEGVDISAGAVQKAGENALSEGLDNCIAYFTGDANFLPHYVGQKKYDVVFGSMALHHFAELETCFESVYQILKPGGLLLRMSLSARTVFNGREGNSMP